MNEHRLQYKQTPDDQVIVTVELTEPECDAARSHSKVPLRAGAVSAGTSYNKPTGEYSLDVRANTKTDATQACNAWLQAINDELTH